MRKSQPHHLRTRRCAVQCYASSNSPAAPMPPPMHIVTTTRLAPRRLPSISAWPVRRCAGHAVGVADGDGAAVDVEAIVGDAELVAAIDHLHRERFVELPEIDVVDLRRRLRSSSLGTAKTGPMPISSGSQPATAKPRKTPSGFRPFLLAPSWRSSPRTRAGAVGELAGVAGGDHAALDRRLDLRRRPRRSCRARMPSSAC